MKSKALILAGITLILVGAAWIASGVQAAPGNLQAIYPSPTPGPDGRILYIVKAGDTCENISLIYGVSLDYLRNTNALDANCSLREGQKLMFGYGGPASVSPTPGPSPVPTLPLPTPTAVAGGKAQTCVLVYNDVNGDGLRQESEAAVAGAAISLTSLDGSYSQTQTSTINPDVEAYQGTCFLDVPMGKYNVSAAAPEGHNPTIRLDSSVEILAGDVIYIDYGVQAGITQAQGTSPGGRSPMLGLLGGGLLVVGLGLGIYVWRVARRR